MTAVASTGILFFAALGTYASGRDASFFAIGNSVQVCAMSGIYGMTMAIANERWFGTLHALLATPASRWAIFGGRFLPFIANGLLVVRTSVPSFLVTLGTLFVLVGGVFAARSST